MQLYDYKLVKRAILYFEDDKNFGDTEFTSRLVDDLNKSPYAIGYVIYTKELNVYYISDWKQDATGKYY